MKHVNALGVWTAGLLLMAAAGCGRAPEDQQPQQPAGEAQWLTEVLGQAKPPAGPAKGADPALAADLPEPATPLEKAIRDYILVMEEYLRIMETANDPPTARVAIAEARKLNSRFDAIIPLFEAQNVWTRPSSFETPFKYKQHLSTIHEREEALEEKDAALLPAGTLPALLAEEHGREPFGPQRVVDELQRRLPAALEKRRRELGPPKPTVSRMGVPEKQAPGARFIQAYGKLKVITVRITNEVPKESTIPLWVYLRSKSGAQQHEAGLVDGVYTVALVAEDMEGFVKKLDIGKVTNVDLVKREITLVLDPAKLPKTP